MMGRLPLAVSLLALSCGDDDAAILGEVSIEPEGPVAACSPLTVHIALEAMARYTISADGSVLAAGFAYPGERDVVIEDLPGPRDPSGRSTLSVSAVGIGGRPERRDFSIPRADDSAPHANAGPSRRAQAGAAVQLDGSASRDPDGDDLGFSWTVVDGDATLAGADGPRPTVTLGSAGSAVVELIVDDGRGGKGIDRVVIRAGDAGAAPEFDDPSEEVVLEAIPGETVEVDVRASSPGSDAPAPRYRFAQATGPAATITQDGSVATIVAPENEGLVAIEAVADNGHDEVRKRISILVGPATVADEPPVPVASAPTSAAVFSAVMLDGSSSTDPEGVELGFLWTVEEAPAGSVLGPSVIPANGTPAAAQARVVLDRVGEYRFRLRAVDGVGPSPAAADVTVTATASMDRTAVDGAVGDIALSEDGEALVTLDGSVVLVGRTGQTELVSQDTAGGVAYSIGRSSFYFGTSEPGAPATIVAFDPVSSEFARQTLPLDLGEDPPTTVNEIGIDPSADNQGDLFLATNAGFVILDVGLTSEAEPIGRPVEIGGEAVHRPPTYNDEGEAALTALDVRGPIDDAITRVFFGNGFWLTVLEQPASGNFTAKPVDPFADGTADPVSAIAVSETDELAMLDGRGLVWMRGDAGADCLLSSGSSRRCPAPASDRCARALSAPPPTDVAALADDPAGTFWIASSDGVRLFDPRMGTFLLLGADEGLDGATAVDALGGRLAVGREGSAEGEVVILELEEP
ncbi:MAG: hypothetical protein HYY06_21265 [Deltaproteobacteria bacterium]|nr:hypothetical protein [Deltaproteobacteria bacterium]